MGTDDVRAAMHATPVGGLVLLTYTANGGAPGRSLWERQAGNVVKLLACHDNVALEERDWYPEPIDDYAFVNDACPYAIPEREWAARRMLVLHDRIDRALALPDEQVASAALVVNFHASGSLTQIGEQPCT